MIRTLVFTAAKNYSYIHTMYMNYMLKMDKIIIVMIVFN